MKPTTLIITIVVLLILVVGLSSGMYVIKEGTQVVVTQFGKPVGEETEAGLHVKIPFIQEVHTLEKRLLPWDGAPETFTTVDKKQIFIDVWARWRITVPRTFFEQVKTDREAQRLLDTHVNSAVRDVVADNLLIEVVRNSNKELVYEGEDLDRSAGERVEKGRDVIEQAILDRVDLTDFGMKVTKVRIKRVNYVASVRQAVYERMIEERLRIARLFDSEAKQEENIIQGQTAKELDQIQGEMQQKSAEIRGAADAQVIKLTAEAYGKSPEFYAFLRQLEVFKNTLGADTRLILGTDNPLFGLLKGDLLKEAK